MAAGIKGAKAIDLTRARGIEELQEEDVGEEYCFKVRMYVCVCVCVWWEGAKGE